MPISISLVSLLYPVLLAVGQDIYVQSDWSCGPGQTDPVAQWTNEFSSESNVAWFSIAGQAVLESNALSNPVQTIITGDAQMPSSIATGDLNGDGLEDVITTDALTVINQFGAIYWWERNLQVQDAWIQHIVDSDFIGAHHAVVADIDGDGDNDVVACAYYGNDALNRNGRFAWFENLNGDASAWKQHVVGEFLYGAEYVDVGDFDGDGDLDIVGTSWLTNGINCQEADVYWFENPDDDSENWTQHTLALFYNNGHEAHAVDIDGDGDMDIVTAQAETPSFLTLWRNVHGDGSVWTEQLLPGSFSGAGFLDTGDIDNDGDMDIIGGGLFTGQTRFWRNDDGLGNNWSVFALPGVGKIKAIELADMDGDGDLDAIFCNNNGATWSGAWWIEHISGNGLSWVLHTIKNNFVSHMPWITVGDTDNNGKLEAVVSIEGTYGDVIEQISSWDVTAFNTSEPGILTSSLLDGGIDPAWSEIQWDAVIFAGTSIEVLVRASTTIHDLGDFVSVPESGSDLSKYIDTNAQYFQYQIQFNAELPDTSPILTEIRVTAGQSNPVGDLDGDGAVGTADLLLLFSSWGPCVDCDLPEACPADLDDDCTVGTSDLLVLFSNWG